MTRLTSLSAPAEERLLHSAAAPGILRMIVSVASTLNPNMDTFDERWSSLQTLRIIYKVIKLPLIQHNDKRSAFPVALHHLVNTIWFNYERINGDNAALNYICS